MQLEYIINIQQSCAVILITIILFIKLVGEDIEDISKIVTLLFGLIVVLILIGSTLFRIWM